MGHWRALFPRKWEKTNICCGLWFAGWKRGLSACVSSLRCSGHPKRAQHGIRNGQRLPNNHAHSRRIRRVSSTGYTKTNEQVTQKRCSAASTLATATPARRINPTERNGSPIPKHGITCNIGAPSGSPRRERTPVARRRASTGHGAERPAGHAKGRTRRRYHVAPPCLQEDFVSGAL